MPLGLQRAPIPNVTLDLHQAQSKTVNTDSSHSNSYFWGLCQLAENLREAERLSVKFQKLLETIPDNYPGKFDIINKLTASYNTVMSCKDNYKITLAKEVKSRELEKVKSFSASSINIKLDKFKGFASELDVYSFRTEFEKIYLKDTPTNKLADLLKHNHLANPALGLVKTLDNITEIWERLEKAYGDPKTILSKLLADVKKMSPVHRLRNSEEIKDGLVNLINGIRDLIKVAKRHNIEAKLYNGDGLATIYASMGDERQTRFLNNVIGENLVDEPLWLRLLEFLELDLKVQQEKALYSRRDERSNPPPNRPGSHFTDQGDDDADGGLKCSLCNERGHATSNSANGTTLVQYFACRRWAEATPAQRFRTLRSKNFCHQCLYPGAKIQNKHATGNCQSTFICPDESHARHPTKKHILVCNEHRENPDNLRLRRNQGTMNSSLHHL